MLLASALLRSGRLSRPTERGAGSTEGAVSSVIAHEDLIRDPVARRVARFLQIAGPSTPGEVAVNLGIPRRTLARKLHLLRSNGLCTVAGKTRTARYALRTDYAAELALADNPGALVDRVQLLLCAQALQAGTRTTIVNAVTSIAATTATGRANRVYAAILLVMASPDYLVQR